MAKITKITKEIAAKTEGQTAQTRLCGKAKIKACKANESVFILNEFKNEAGESLYYFEIPFEQNGCTRGISFKTLCTKADETNTEKDDEGYINDFVASSCGTFVDVCRTLVDIPMFAAIDAICQVFGGREVVVTNKKISCVSGAKYFFKVELDKKATAAELKKVRELAIKIASAGMKVEE